MRDTVTEYKTVEEEKEVVRSDFSGDVLDDGKHISLLANPYPKSEYLEELECDGEIHMSVGEFAELSGVDESSINADEELPEVYVNKAAPEVVEKQYIPDINVEWGVAVFILAVGNIAGLAHMLYVNEVVGPLGDVITNPIFTTLALVHMFLAVISILIAILGVLNFFDTVKV